MKILIETIPHPTQRYPTPGDWEWKNALNAGLAKPTDPIEKRGESVLHVRVSNMKDLRHEWLMAIHEVIEAMLCTNDCVSAAEVDSFDKQWKPIQAFGECTEPGNDPKAPYYHQHRFASVVEELLAMELKVDWQAYDAEVKGL
jgi:hypothetical protein